MTQKTNHQETVPNRAWHEHVTLWLGTPLRGCVWVEGGSLKDHFPIKHVATRAGVFGVIADVGSRGIYCWVDIWNRGWPLRLLLQAS